MTDSTTRPSEWTPQHAADLTRPGEVRVTTTGKSGATATTIIWIVGHDGRVFVRSTNGPTAAWYRRALARPGAVHAAGVDYDVTFTPVSAETDLAAVDDAYRRKYGRYASIVDHLQSADPRAATLEVHPRR